MWEPGQGLNGAVAAGVEQLAPGRRRVGDRGPRRSSPGPRPRIAGALRRHHPGARPPGRRDQRPRLPAACGFRFAYGPGFVPQRTGPRRPGSGLPVRVSAHTGSGLRRRLAGRRRRAHRMTDRARTAPGPIPVNDLPAGGRHLAATCRPAVALAVGAHPDDIEFGCGGTLAKWAAGGTAIHHLVLTDGAKGSWDPERDQAIPRRPAPGRATPRRRHPRRRRRRPSSAGPTASSAMPHRAQWEVSRSIRTSAPTSSSATTRGAATGSIRTTATPGSS